MAPPAPPPIAPTASEEQRKQSGGSSSLLEEEDFLRESTTKPLVGAIRVKKKKKGRVTRSRSGTFDGSMDTLTTEKKLSRPRPHRRRVSTRFSPLHLDGHREFKSSSPTETCGYFLSSDSSTSHSSSCLRSLRLPCLRTTVQRLRRSVRNKEDFEEDLRCCKIKNPTTQARVR